MTRILFALLFVASSAHATWTVVQHVATGAACSSPCTVSLTQATGTGNVIVVLNAFSNTTSVTISSVSGGGTYTIPAGCHIFNSTSQVGANCAFTKPSTSGATSVVVTMSAASSNNFSVREYHFTALAALTGLDGNPNTITDASACTTCDGVTLPLTGNDVIIQVAIMTSGGSASLGFAVPRYNASTLDLDSVNDGYGEALNTSNGSGSQIWFQSNSQSMLGMAIAFAEPGGGVSKGNKLHKLGDEF